jgi:hypothetical protein
MSTPPDEYEAAWEDLRRRRRLFFLPMQIGFLIGIFAVVLRLVFGDLHWFGMVLAISFGISLVITFIGGLRAGQFRCARCGKNFRLLDKCGHCGLRAFESKEWQFMDLRNSS